MRNHRVLMMVTCGLLLSGCATSPSGHSLAVLTRKAQVAYDKGQAAQALADYQALAGRLHDPTVWTRVGNLYALEGHPHKAVRAYLQSTRLDPQDGQAWYNLAVVRLRIAWATLIEAYNTTPPADPVRKRIKQVIHLFRKMARTSRLPSLRDTASPPKPGRSS
jgi:tetratricopeptide (TPR) repeat protein